MAESFDTGPGPTRRAFLLAYAAVFVAGVLGALIGYGVTDLGSRGDKTVATALGAIVGAVIAAGGAGFVAVVVLRAMAEWRRPPR